MTPFQSPAVAALFDAYPTAVRTRLLALRELIFDTAAATDGVGEIDETLKWGEPAYLTSASGSGSTLRINRVRGDAGRYALYVNCKTNLVETFKTLFPGEFRFEGQRAIVFDVAEPVQRDALSFCIAAALTYHRRKTSAQPRR